MTFKPLRNISRDRVGLRQRASRRKARTAPTQREWKAGVTRNIPWTSILAILIIILAATAAAIVICITDKKTADDWKLSPTVVLSALATIAGMCIRYAFEEAATVCWWWQALQGTTIEQLDNEYQYSKDVTATFMRPIRSFSTLRWASILATLFVLNGPLLQQAVKFESTEALFQPEIVVPIQVRPMWNLTIRNDGSNEYQYEFKELIEDASYDEKIGGFKIICEGVCRTTVVLAGFARSCGPRVITSDDISQPGQSIGVYQLKVEGYNLIDLDPTDPSKDVIFQDRYAYNISNGGIKVSGYYRDAGGSLNTRECYLRPAYVYRNIVIQNNTISFDRSILGTDGGYIPETAAMMSNSTHLNVTMGGWIKFLKEKYEGYATYAEDVEQGYSVVNLTKNAMPLFIGGNTTQDVLNGFFNSASASIDSKMTIMRKSNEPFSFDDPIARLYSSLEDLALRYAVLEFPHDRNRTAEWEAIYGKDFTSIESSAMPYKAWTPNPSGGGTPRILNNGNNQSCIVQQVRPAIVLRMNVPFLIAALFLTLIPTVLISFMLTRWRHIGRRVSMSPMEIAKAFDAPVLRSGLSNSNAKTSDVVCALGQRRIRYGSIALSQKLEGSSEEAVDAAQAENPTELSLQGGSGSDEEGSSLGNLRLTIMREDEVQQPRNGMIYV